MTVRKVHGTLFLQESAGGLATGLGAIYQEHKAAWVGWPGDVAPSDRLEVERRLRSEHEAHPVFLPVSLASRHYAGFANRTLWPLFHSFASYARYSSREWDAYRKVNELFCDRISEIVQPGDTIWVHDYHLMVLPSLLRNRFPDAKIGFFLHIPFPPYETLRLLPWQLDLVRGLLAADLIGFHTYDYAQAFLWCVRRLLGLDNEIGQILVGRRVAQVDVFPMGVDFERFTRAAEDSRVRSELQKFRRRIGPMKLVFSMSRLDYTKGIPEQLLSFQTFFERHPEWRGRLVYLCIVVPSREKVDRYALLKREIDELVGRINSRFGTIDWVPIRYMYRRLTDEELAALYARADIALILPLRDGMNLIAKEYLATRADERGVLILSELAGASKELLEALIVNPNGREEVADAIHRALTMPEEEQVRRNRAMRSRLQEHDVRWWAKRFLHRLEVASTTSSDLAVRILTADRRRDLLARYAKARKRLLLLDYDGTLVPFAADPDAATPSSALLDVLERLASAAENEVVLISGRRRQDLENWFGSLPLTLVAEHGAWVRSRGSSTWETTVNEEPRWKESVSGILDLFVNRVPGSAIEEKDFSLVWHYRRSAVESGALAAKELIDTLTNLTANLDILVLPGNRIVEVRTARATKGEFFASRLAGETWDFLLAVGDDVTDEHLFKTLPRDSFSIRVGVAASAARFNVEAPEDVVSLLEEMTRADGG